MENWNECSFNGENPILLFSKSILARLYAEQVHNECHLGVSALAAKIRAKYWIVGVRKLLKSIKFHCVTCRKLGERLHQQRMGPLPPYRLKPAPAWSYTSLDMFGPLEIKGGGAKNEPEQRDMACYLIACLAGLFIWMWQLTMIRKRFYRF